MPTRSVVHLTTGNIAAQPDVDAIVNAANADLLPGGGVAGAIHRAAGPELAAAGKEYAPISPGQAVITRAFRLPNKYVIHCLGPVYGRDQPADQLLADCYRNALRLAEQHDIRSIAFPSISTGAFGYPMEAAADVAFRTILEAAPKLKTVEHVRFVLHDERALDIHRRALERVQRASGESQ